MNRLLTFFFFIAVLLGKAYGQCSTPTDTVTTSILACQPYTWAENGNTYNESTSESVLSSDGCTLSILNLTMYENQVEVKRIFTCDSYFWSETGETYTSTGTYSYQETTEAGCIIAHQLILTVSNAYNSSEGAADCDTYTWQEMDFPSGGMVGSAVDLDASGTILAVGDETAGTAGEVRVYQWSEAGWAQMGATLTAEYNPERFGASVSLSANGKYLAVGSPSRNPAGGFATYGQVKVFEWSGTSWLQRGGVISGIDDFDELGYSVDLSNDGNVLAAGAPSSGRVTLELGEVRVYQWTGDDWTQMGDHIYKYEFINSPNNNGYSVSLSGDGTKLIFGAPFSHGILKNTPGKYFVFEWDGTKWSHFRNTQGNTDQERLGWSVAITNDGDKIAASSHAYSSNTGKVLVNFKWLTGETAGASFGKSFAINEDAQVLAVGSPLYSSTNEYVGKVEVFRDAGDGHQQVGQDITGTTTNEQLGSAVALNHTGNIMAVNGKIYYYGCTNSTQNCTPSTCTGSIASTVDTTACNSYNFDGIVYFESGTYEASFISQEGCDSLVTLNLTITPTVYSYDITACDSYLFNGSTLTSSGTYSASWPASTTYTGCDSSVVIYLTITDTMIEIEESVTACDSYEFGGELLTETGIYYDTISGGSTCDSLLTLNLTIADQEVMNQTVSSCEKYVFGEDTLTVSGVYEKTFVNQSGCDSLVTLALTIKSTSEAVISVAACGSYEFNGTSLTSSGNYQATFINQQGCDSLVTLDLTILETSTETIAVISCESYEFNGETLTSSDTYTATFTNAVGCDSLVTLNLTIVDSTGTTTVAACESYVSPSGNYTWTSSGSYTDSLSDTSECGHIITINLTINHSTTGTDVVTACDSYTWIDGNTYTSSTNSAIYTLTNAVGCDSIVNLDLTILPGDEVSTSVETCGSYTFNGAIYEASGEYPSVFTNQAGCDSLVTLNLTIHPEPVALVALENGMLAAGEQEGVTYQWIVCETGGNLEGETERQLTPPGEGEYAVIVTNGVCSVTSDCYSWERTTVLGEVPEPDELTVYPNPTTDAVTLAGLAGEATVRILSVTGKVVSEARVGPGKKIPIPGASGLYILRIQSGDSVALKRIHKR